VAGKAATQPATLKDGLANVARELASAMMAPDAGPAFPVLQQMMKATTMLAQAHGAQGQPQGGPPAPGGAQGGSPIPGYAGKAAAPPEGPPPAPGGTGGGTPTPEDARRLIGASA
jgi:hypothetical protein